MAGHIATLAGQLNPGKWSRDPASPEESLRTFNEWIEEFDRWIDICDMHLSPKQRWALMISTGKEDLKDLVVKQAGVQIKQQDFVQAVDHVPAVPAGPGGDPPARQEVQAVIGREALVPTPWEEGIELCRKAITKYSNQISARHKLFTKMPAGDYPDWRKWTIELLEQANRCNWDNYKAESAALDALLYQCPDAAGRSFLRRAMLHSTSQTASLDLNQPAGETWSSVSLSSSGINHSTPLPPAWRTPQSQPTTFTISTTPEALQMSFLKTSSNDPQFHASSHFTIFSNEENTFVAAPPVL